VSNDVDASLVGGVQLEHPLFVNIRLTKKLATEGDGRRRFARARGPVEEQVWQLNANLCIFGWILCLFQIF
jgi:hypothetical protein